MRKVSFSSSLRLIGRGQTDSGSQSALQWKGMNAKMKTSTKVIAATAAGILSAGIATAGAFAATGSLSVSDTPGQVLKLSGVGPAAAHASKEALSHANQNAKGLFGDLPTSVPTPTGLPVPTSTPVSGDASNDTSATAKANAPTSGAAATKGSSTAKGDANGDAVSAWAKANGGAQVVTPPAAVDVQVDLSAKAGH